MSELKAESTDNVIYPFFNKEDQSVNKFVPYITKEGFVESWGQKKVKFNLIGAYQAARWHASLNQNRFNLFLEGDVALGDSKNALYAEWNAVQSSNNGQTWIPTSSDRIRSTKSEFREKELEKKKILNYEVLAPNGAAGAGAYKNAVLGGVVISIKDSDMPEDKGLYIISSIDDKKDLELNYLHQTAVMVHDVYEYDNSGDINWKGIDKWAYINKLGRSVRKSSGGSYAMQCSLTVPLVCSYDVNISKWTHLKDKHLKLESNPGYLYEGIPLIKPDNNGTLEFQVRIINDNEKNKNENYNIYVYEKPFSKNQTDFSKGITINPKKIEINKMTTIKCKVEKQKEYFMFIKGVEDTNYNGKINYFSDYTFLAED